jgi:hypothetical protein
VWQNAVIRESYFNDLHDFLGYTAIPEEHAAWIDFFLIPGVLQSNRKYARNP